MSAGPKARTRRTTFAAGPLSTGSTIQSRPIDKGVLKMHAIFIMMINQPHVYLIGLHSVLAPDADCSPSMAALPLENSTFPDSLPSVSAERIGRPGAGVLVIIPEMVLSCYSLVSRWMAIFSMNTESLQLLASQEELLLPHFQVWRPVGNVSFMLVWSKPLVSNSTIFSEAQQQISTLGMDDDGSTYYQSPIAFTVTTDGLRFEPGDVVGCFIPAVSFGDSPSASLGLAFRNESSQAGKGGEEVDLLVYPVEGDICDAVVCEDSMVMISSVQPLLYPYQECESNLPF